MGIEDIDLGEDFDFEQMLNESFENAENNSVVDGVIVDINAERVLVDVGQKIEGSHCGSHQFGAVYRRRLRSHFCQICMYAQQGNEAPHVDVVARAE